MQGRQVFYGKLPKQIGATLRDLCGQNGVEVLEGRCMPDHIHVCLSVSSKYSIAHTIGFLKGKSAVRLHRGLLHERRMSGLPFWSTGYYVSTVGMDEMRVRQDIREQEQLQCGKVEPDFK